ncbi:hypothetical protein C5C22_05065 [Rathayibacter rathayi]|nr:hypothetical protein C5C22_05065 [Rathayibacter rathayi]
MLLLAQKEFAAQVAQVAEEPQVVLAEVLPRFRSGSEGHRFPALLFPDRSSALLGLFGLSVADRIGPARTRSVRRVPPAGVRLE